MVEIERRPEGPPPVYASEDVWIRARLNTSGEVIVRGTVIGNLDADDRFGGCYVEKKG
jgi:hypothetical protein